MNRIKKTIFGVSIFILLFSILSCKVHPAQITTDERRDTTLLDLFYGMEKHYEEQDGCVLDSIPGVLHLEMESKWLTSDADELYQYIAVRYNLLGHKLSARSQVILASG